MKIKTIQDESYGDYRCCCMLIATYTCNWKCAYEGNYDISICQNNTLTQTPTIEIENEKLIQRYLDNPLSHAIVIGGLEPLDDIQDIINFIAAVREKTNDTIIIYTGYYPHEIEKTIAALQKFKNIIVKFGRYIPDTPPRYDEVLGVNLISNNQIAYRIS